MLSVRRIAVCRQFFSCALHTLTQVFNVFGPSTLDFANIHFGGIIGIAFIGLLLLVRGVVRLTGVRALRLGSRYVPLSVRFAIFHWHLCSIRFVYNILWARYTTSTSHLYGVQPTLSTSNFCTLWGRRFSWKMMKIDHKLRYCFVCCSSCKKCWLTTQYTQQCCIMYVWSTKVIDFLSKSIVRRIRKPNERNMQLKLQRDFSYVM